jgi:hypothetical protein
MWILRMTHFSSFQLMSRYALRLVGSNDTI